MCAAVAWFVLAADRTDGKGWPPAERAAFMRNCVEQCRAAPGVSEAQYPACQAACACAADEGEKTMTAQDLESAARAIGSGKASAEQTAKLDGLKAAGARCAAGASPTPK